MQVVSRKMDETDDESILVDNWLDSNVVMDTLK